MKLEDVIDKVVACVCSFSIFMLPLFFAFMGLIGVEYTGSDNSVAYVAYVASVAALAFASYLYATALKGFVRGEGALILFALLFLGSHMVWVIVEPERTPLLPEFLIFSAALGAPGFFSAAAMVKLRLEKSLIRFSEAVVAIISLGVVVYSVFPSLLGAKTSNLAGANYQTLSYFSVFAFGMLLIYNTLIPSAYRYIWSRSIFWRVVSYGLMLGCVVGCFLGGGRGAFLLLLVYILFYLFAMLFEGKGYLNANSILKSFGKFACFVALAAIFLNFFWEKDFVQAGFARATMFVSADGGVDLERGSSGRDVVYAIAMDFISQRPLLGYGPFGFMEKTIHAHNIFLEIILQIGVVGLIVLLLWAISLLVIFIKNWSVVSIWVASLFMYPLIMLMFSGSYLHNAVFIFCISYFALCKNRSVTYRSGTSSQSAI